MKKNILLLLFTVLGITLLANGIFFARTLTRLLQPSPPPQKDFVTTSIYPLGDLVRQVAGNELEVITLIKPGANPHSFQPSPQDLQHIAGSQAVFMIGHGFDTWLEPLTKNSNAKQVVVDKNVQLQAAEEDHEGEAESDGNDPHYWLDPKNAEGMVQQISEELSQVFPAKAEVFRENSQAYIASLRKTDQQVKDMLSDLPTRKIATFHNAFGYFAAAYDLEVVSTFEEFPGQEPGPQYLAKFEQKVKAGQLKAIFAEPQSPALALEPIAEDLGVKILILDDLGGADASRDSYLKLLLFNAQQIKTAASL